MTKYTRKIKLEFEREYKTLEESKQDEDNFLRGIIGEKNSYEDKKEISTINLFFGGIFLIMGFFIMTGILQAITNSIKQTSLISSVMMVVCSLIIFTYKYEYDYTRKNKEK
jgi:uncharacterized membrane protein YcjF (UPF0283 family)